MFGDKLVLGDGPVYPIWAKISLSLSLSLSLPLERNPIEWPVSRGEAIEARLQARIFSGIRGYMSGN